MSRTAENFPEAELPFDNGPPEPVLHHDPLDRYADNHAGKMIASIDSDPVSALQYYAEVVPPEIKHHPRILNALSRIYSQHLHNYEKAKELLRISLKRNPNNIVTKTMLAQVLFRQGYDALARKLLLQVLKRDPNNIPARILLLHWALDHQLPEVANALIDEIAQREPDNPALPKLRQTLAGSQRRQ